MEVWARPKKLIKNLGIIIKYLPQHFWLMGVSICGGNLLNEVCWVLEKIIDRPIISEWPSRGNRILTKTELIVNCILCSWPSQHYLKTEPHYLSDRLTSCVHSTCPWDGWNGESELPDYGTDDFSALQVLWVGVQTVTYQSRFCYRDRGLVPCYARSSTTEGVHLMSPSILRIVYFSGSRLSSTLSALRVLNIHGWIIYPPNQ